MTPVIMAFLPEQYLQAFPPVTSGLGRAAPAAGPADLLTVMSQDPADHFLLPAKRRMAKADVPGARR